MFLSALSPARTPSKSANVEKLLSLQKSTKHLSDADILSVAAEASAMKRQQAKFVSNLENVEPNTRTLPRRLFDINECSKGATGFYVSPEKAVTKPADLQSNHNTLTVNSDSDSDLDTEIEEEIDTTKQADKHFAQIIDIVNHKANRQPTKSLATHTALNTHNTYAVVPTSTSEQNASEHDATTSFDYDGYTPEPESTPQEVQEVPVEPVQTAEGIRELVVRHILSVLNTGTYEEILALHGIGQVRALRIFTVRNAGATFGSMQDFADTVYMNDYTLSRFLKANAAHIMVQK